MPASDAMMTVVMVELVEKSDLSSASHPVENQA
jgi:hypothetical protein